MTLGYQTPRTNVSPNVTNPDKPKDKGLPRMTEDELRKAMTADAAAYELKAGRGGQIGRVRAILADGEWHEVHDIMDALPAFDITKVMHDVSLIVRRGGHSIKTDGNKKYIRKNNV